MVGCLNRSHPFWDSLVSRCEGNHWKMRGVPHHPCCLKDQQLTQGLSPKEVGGHLKAVLASHRGPAKTNLGCKSSTLLVENKCIHMITKSRNIKKYFFTLPSVLCHGEAQAATRFPEFRSNTSFLVEKNCCNLFASSQSSIRAMLMSRQLPRKGNSVRDPMFFLEKE